MVQRTNKMLGESKTINKQNHIRFMRFSLLCVSDWVYGIGQLDNNSSEALDMNMDKCSRPLGILAAMACEKCITLVL